MSSKRKTTTPADEKEPKELEIDVSLPEPPSKKAKRNAKKGKEGKDTTTEPSNPAISTSTTTIADSTTQDLVKAYFNSDAAQASREPPVAQRRSEHGVWIGNLPFSATRESLRDFLSREGGIEGRDVTRLHMPTPMEKGTRVELKVQNKGFAYVDFTTREILDKALALSEKLLSGRRVLIKNAKSFEGRPQKASDATSNADGRRTEPSKRIFVGNLGFDITRDELVELFGQAGEVEDLHMATFEDSGKCKGFAWVRFATLEAAETAVKGYVYRDAEDDDEAIEIEDHQGDEDDVEIVTDIRGSKKGAQRKGARKNQRRKHFINRLHGRPLRCEFAEDAQTRYKKRFGKGTADHRLNNNAAPYASGAHDAGQDSHELEDPIGRADAEREPGPDRRRKPDQERRRDDRRRRHDARTSAPREPLASTQRASGAIVAGVGQKISFE